MICSRIGLNLIRVFLSPEQACVLTHSAPHQGLRERASSPCFPQGSQKDPRSTLARSHPHPSLPSSLPSALKLRWACSQLHLSLCTQHTEDFVRWEGAGGVW